MTDFDTNRGEGVTKAGSSQAEGARAKPSVPERLGLCDPISTHLSPKHALEWLRMRDFCVIYGTTPPTVRRWIAQGRVKAVQVPPCPRGRLLILDPKWTIIDTPISSDPAESMCVLRQVDIAAITGVTTRTVRNWAAGGKIHFRSVGGRNLCSVSELRRVLARRQSGKQNVSRKECNLAIRRWALQKLQKPPAVR